MRIVSRDRGVPQLLKQGVQLQSLCPQGNHIQDEIYVFRTPGASLTAN
jgi:hypothetical protein